MENTIESDHLGVTAGATVNRTLVGQLLRMAHQYQSEGNIRQATEMFWTLVESYQGTPEADAAKAALLSIAEGYESNNARRMAHSMFMKLISLEN